jgi:hypothetical protein
MGVFIALRSQSDVPHPSQNDPSTGNLGKHLTTILKLLYDSYAYPIHPTFRTEALILAHF